MYTGRTHLVGPVVNRFRVVDLLAKPMDHLRWSPANALKEVNKK